MSQQTTELQATTVEEIWRAYQQLAAEYKRALKILAIHAPADYSAKEVLEASKNFQLEL